MDADKGTLRLLSTAKLPQHLVLSGVGLTNDSIPLLRQFTQPTIFSFLGTMITPGEFQTLRDAGLKIEWPPPSSTITKSSN